MLGSETTLYKPVMVGTCHSPFAQTHRMCITISQTHRMYINTESILTCVEIAWEFGGQMHTWEWWPLAKNSSVLPSLASRSVANKQLLRISHDYILTEAACHLHVGIRELSQVVQAWGSVCAAKRERSHCFVKETLLCQQRSQKSRLWFFQ